MLRFLTLSCLLSIAVSLRIGGMDAGDSYKDPSDTQEELRQLRLSGGVSRKRTSRVENMHLGFKGKKFFSFLMVFQQQRLPSVISTSPNPAKSTRQNPARREVLASVLPLSWLGTASAEAGDLIEDPFHYRVRDYSRKSQWYEGKYASRDYFFKNGQLPPRSLDYEPGFKQPEFNAWGRCSANACTYVSIPQRYKAYSTYGFPIEQGLFFYSKLGRAVSKRNWDEVTSLLESRIFERLLLKAGLLSGQLLVSPNNPTEDEAASVARFYVNEAGYAIFKLAQAAGRLDGSSADAAWDFGRDSLNSYINVVNPSIVEKVGDKFLKIEGRQA